MNTFTDYYALLGVDVNASPGDIKGAFKKLALQYHPDVYKGDDAHERMREILRAYQTLNDPEARRQYDRQRAEHVQDFQHTTPVTQQSPSSARTSVQNRSSSARRDRKRAYAFPDIKSGSPLHVSLLDMEYALSVEQAQTLQQQGVVRGIAPENNKGDYHCHRCKHVWTPSSVRLVDEGHLPLFCPNCGAGDWAEYLLLRCIHCCAIFESEQIRYQVGSVHYGKSAHAGQQTQELCPPYELFPLCPYCGLAHWCPSEEMRVAQMRTQLARKAAMMRMFWISLTLFALIMLGIVAVMVR